jgi:pyridoxal phosphate enzyme (YggS family)
MIKEQLLTLKNELPDSVRLVAVSKTKPLKDIMEAYEAGHRDFGENKIQEMAAKYQDLPKDIRWHMIGHVQRNKVKYMAEFVHLIHGVDSLKLLKEIDKQAKNHNRIIPCLLQARIASEETKFGMPFTDIQGLLASDELPQLHNIQIVGFMGMATFTDDKAQIRKEFKSLYEFFSKIQHSACNILSMGMSDDYKIAIEEGSTMIRVGSAIFGLRNYIS